VSVVTLKRKAGNKRAYKVQFRDHNGKLCSENYSAKVDAERRDVEVRQAKQRREPIPRRGRGDQKETLATFAQGVWWPQRAAQLQKKTQAGYAAFLDKHLIPRIGDEPIAFIDVERCIELRAELAKDGVPGYTAARALKLLRQILAHAVLIQRLPYNPADVFGQRGQLPSQKRKSPMRPLWPDDTEAIRRAILARKTPNALRDATLVSVMAYAGLRPEEALALAWEHVGKSTIRVERANTNGSFNQTKTGHHRTVAESLP
jgi:integrase